MVLDLVVIGLAITLYPLPVLALGLVVSARRGVWKGLAFVLAWLGCLVLVITIVLLLTGGQPPPPRSPPSTAVLAAKLALGVGLIVYSEHRRRLRRSARADAGATTDATTGATTGAKAGTRTDASGSSMTSRLDQASAWSAATVAVLLQPWGMVGLAATTVVQADLSHASSFFVLTGFCLLASASLLVMELYAVFAPERAQAGLASLRVWLTAHKDPAIILTCLVAGVWMTGRSLSALTG
ncbi:hypothetical protein DEJ50_01300 [Streptomyces venezuelae]|uniref:GAP family protein n=1 Tax=Streptomyces venezuelae TaxID=54571 RepID=A0A5P2CY41_STRVZ|nr:GAP family protein [Streptomyces venezuelae]QES46688.1 hypothetical protein DEJ50_01300 [Streptomyces venezuelae]